MQAAIDQNPFDSLRASDYSDAEVVDHWVDLSAEQGGLESLLKPRLVMPMLLLGGKGSGKTHLMRYFSAPVQTALNGGDLTRALKTGGYLGVYIRTEGLNIHKFSDKGQDEELWIAVFGMYFELWLASNLLNNCVSLLQDRGNQFDKEFSRRVAALFDVDVSSEFSSAITFLEYISNVKRKIDYVVNNAALTRSVSDLKITFSLGRLIFGIPEALSTLVPEFKDVLFVYLIDELENFTLLQQRLVNTLIRYRRGSATIKLGARLYGIKTYDTLGSGEPIKRDAEYERVELDGFLREHEDQYKKFCHALIVNRLQLNNLPVVRGEQVDLREMFEELDSRNFYQTVTLALVKTWDKPGKDRPYFDKFRKELIEGLSMDAVSVNSLVAELKVPEYPLVEKALLLSFYREWPASKAVAAKLAAELAEEARVLLQGKSKSNSRPLKVLRYFGSDLLAQLFRDCRRKCPYAGLEILIHLSQGAPRNLLAILKHIYRRSLFAGERPFAGGVISVDAQSLGVTDSATWYWEDAQPESYGKEVRDGIEALAVLFRTIRYSERPSECDLCTFSVILAQLTPNSRTIVETAENWSFLIRTKVDAKNRNNQLVDAKYQLAPMLVPKWGLSPHRRGSIEIKSELANAIFDSNLSDKLVKLFSRRVGEMRAETFVKGKSHSGGLPLS